MNRVSCSIANCKKHYDDHKYLDYHVRVTHKKDFPFFRLQNLFVDTISYFMEGIYLNYKEDNIICKVSGCKKIFNNINYYKQHIKTYRHPISRIFKEYSDDKNLRISFEEIKRILKDLNIDDTFEIEVVHYDSSNYDFYSPILLYNDFNRSSFMKPKRNLVKELVRSSFHGIPSGRNSKIDKIIYKNNIWTDKKLDINFYIRYYNIEEFISSSDMSSSRVYVGTKTSYAPEVMFNFDSRISRIYVFDFMLNLLEILELPFGYARKIKILKIENEEVCLCLFNDGKLRYIKSKDRIEDLKGEGYIDFDIIDENKYVVSDGFRIFIIDNNKIIHRSDPLDSAILSVCYKKITTREVSTLEDHDDSNTSSLTENNSTLRILKSKIIGNKIFCTTISSVIYSFDEELRNKIDLCHMYLSSSMKFLSEYDVVFFNDNLHNKSRFLKIENGYCKTYSISDNAFYSIECLKDTIFTGNYNGTVNQSYIDTNRTLEIQILKFKRINTELYIIPDNEGSDSKDYCTVVVDIKEKDNFLFIFLRCGVIFKYFIS